jgi:hypothetical protein
MSANKSFDILKTEFAKIFYQKHGRCPGVSLAENMNLPQPGNKTGYMFYNLPLT